MCVICGFLADHERPTSIATDMLQKTAHRGPDAHGLYIDGEIWRSRDLSDLECLEPARVCLGHSELSLTEGLDSLVQPVGSPDGSLSLVLNGEIYNRQELRELLIDNVEIDKEAGDCEILMHLIGEIHEGNLLKTMQSVLKLLNGMYALAVTDSKEIVIARDPLGIKPIYYVVEEGRFYFCSEKKGLYNLGGTIKRITPGKILRVSETGISLHQGVQIERPQVDVIDSDEAVARYKETLTGAVERMLCDLRRDKVGMIFSSGVDSVLIAKLISDFGWPERWNNMLPRVFCARKKRRRDLAVFEHGER